MEFQDAAKVIQTTEEERVAESNQIIDKKSRHPIITGFHVGLKALSIILYILFFFLLDGYFVISFSLCLLLTAVDFWMTKNINGRLLAGLRYWNKINEDGSSQWVFEALESHQKVRLSHSELIIFWATLIICPILWFGTCFLMFFTISFNYLCLSIICLVMQISNLIGFIRCARGSRAVLKRKAKKVAVEQGTKAAINMAKEQF